MKNKLFALSIARITCIVFIASLIASIWISEHRTELLLTAAVAFAVALVSFSISKMDSVK